LNIAFFITFCKKNPKKSFKIGDFTGNSKCKISLTILFMCDSVFHS